MGKIIRYWHSGRTLDKELFAVEPRSLRFNPKFGRYVDKNELSAYVPRGSLGLGLDRILYRTKRTASRVSYVDAWGIPVHLEGGRSATLDDKIFVKDQEFSLNVKGSGTRVSLRNSDNQHCFVALDQISMSTDRDDRRNLREFSSGRYAYCITDIKDDFGRPLGGQRTDWSLDALKLSDGIFSPTLGMYICPVLAAIGVPNEFVANGPNKDKALRQVSQDLRLMPSNVRLKQDWGVAKLSREMYLEITRKSETRKSDFAYNLYKTISQICSLEARTARPRTRTSGYSALTFHGVDPQKDGVIAADGKMYFADLEGITKKNFASYARIISNLKDTLINVLNSARCIYTETHPQSFYDFVFDNKAAIQSGLPKEVELRANREGFSLDYDGKP